MVLKSAAKTPAWTWDCVYSTAVYREHLISESIYPDSRSSAQIVGRGKALKALQDLRVPTITVVVNLASSIASV